MKEPVASSSIKDQEMSGAKCEAEVLYKPRVCYSYTFQAIITMNKNSLSPLNNQNTVTPNGSQFMKVLVTDQWHLFHFNYHDAFKNRFIDILT